MLDWANSRAMKLALNSDDDDFAAELKILVAHVCEVIIGLSKHTLSHTLSFFLTI